jgi:hypothetical protein
LKPTLNAPFCSTRSLPALATLLLAGIGLPGLAQASVHGDLTPVLGAVAGAGGVLSLGSLGLLYACYLFWKWGKADWLFAAVVVLVVPGSLLSWLAMLLGAMLSSQITVWLVTGTHVLLSLVNWGFLWFALREKKRRALSPAL